MLNVASLSKALSTKDPIPQIQVFLGMPTSIFLYTNWHLVYDMGNIALVAFSFPLPIPVIQFRLWCVYSSIRTNVPFVYVHLCVAMFAWAVAIIWFAIWFALFDFQLQKDF